MQNAAAVDTKAPTIPAPAPVAECACGCTYDAGEWLALGSRRPWVFPDEVLEIAECRCGSTLAVEVAA